MRLIRCFSFGKVSNSRVNAIRQSLENLLKSTYKSNLKIPKFIIDSQYKLCYFITIKFKSNVDEQREYIRNEITESCRWWKTVWNSLWNGFVRRQVKEIRVAAAVIPALKDKSIERDFRTLK